MITTIIVIVLSVESIVLHEIAHGYAALMFGDHTARDRGRLTLNPIPHVDRMWTVVIPVIAYILSKGSFIIGGAKPVPVNPYNFRRKVLGDICVSVAGVSVNFLIAIVMILLLNVVLLFLGGAQAEVVWNVLKKVARLNIVLAMFNLIPIPPLDGSHLFKYLLPLELRSDYEKLGRTGVGFIILIIFINLPVVWRVFDAVLIWLENFMVKTLILF